MSGFSSASMASFSMIEARMTASRNDRPSVPYAWRMAGVTCASKRASIRSTRVAAVVSLSTV